MSFRKRFRWTADLERVLLDIWEHSIGDLRKRKRNSHVYTAMAQQLKMACAAETDGIIIHGRDIKIKISNLTQRYRYENKAVGLSGGKRSDWQWYDHIDRILGSLPSLCNNGASLVQNSLQLVSETRPVLDGDTNSETDHEGLVIVKEELRQEVFASPITSISTACSSASSRRDNASAVTTKRKLHKRKAQEDIDRDFLHEIRRSNDLTEQELKQNELMRRAQFKCLAALEASATAILNCINKNSNKDS